MPKTTTPEVCFCKHEAANHLHGLGSCQKCDCKGLHLRPCICGHGIAEHVGKCKHPGCECRSVRIDRSPEFLLRMGLGSGSWQFISTPQLEYLMRPTQEHKVRVFAAGLKMAMGNNRRLAVKFKGGKQVPATPADILSMLNATEKIGRLQRQHVYRALLELEKDGVCRQSGRPVRGARLLYFYARPRPSRLVAEDPNTETETPAPETEEIVITSGYNVPLNLTDERYLRDVIILPAKASLVKIVSKSLREALPENSFVITDGYKEELEKIVEDALNVLADGYKRLSIVTSHGAFVTAGDAAYKEVFNSLPSSLSSSSPTLANPVHSGAKTTTRGGPPDLISEALSAYVTTDPDAVRQLRAKVLEMDTAATDGEIIQAIHEKGRLAQKKNSPMGFLLVAVPNLFRGHQVWLAEMRQPKAAPVKYVSVWDDIGGRLRDPATQEDALWEVEGLDIPSDLADLVARVRAAVAGRKNGKGIAHA